MRPVAPAQRTQPHPQSQQQLIPLRNLLLQLPLQPRKPLDRLAPRRLQLRYPRLLRADSDADVVVRLLERLELRLGRAVRLPLLLEKLRQPAGLEAVRLEEGVALADEVVLLDDVGLCGVELADRFLELAL